jgi:hypothetical protein
MAFYDSTWYANFGNGTSTGYYAVTVRPQNTAVAAGVLRRQFTAPAVGSERVFVCIVAGTTANTTDATWVTTRGAKTTDGTATWQECTGAAAVNGDLTNTATWATAKATGTPTLGAIIKRNNGASYQICSTAGTMGASEPSFSDTAGVTTNDGTSVWTSLGVVGSFTGGQAPHARLANACTSTWFAAGNTVYVADNHAESQATAVTISPAGSLSTIARILCHDHTASYPPAAANLMSGATVSTTAGSVNTTFSPLGPAYVYGVAFKAGVGASSAASHIILTATAGGYVYFDNCSFWLSNSAAANTSGLQLGSTSNSNIVFNNTTVRFAVATNAVAPGYGKFLWQNTGSVLASGSSVPNFLFNFGSTASNAIGFVNLEALDLSQLTGNICNYTTNTTVTDLAIKDCKLNAAMAVAQPGNTGMMTQIVRSDSGATAYLSSRYAYEGTETTETSITRVGGAVDPSGQAQTRKIVTTANTQWLRPFLGEPYAIWNTTTGATVTVTVYGTINAGAVPNNDDIWIEVAYLGSSATPVGTFVSSTKASVLAANAAVASDGSSWNGGGSGGGWSPFKLTTTLSSPQPGMSGYIDVRVRAAKASTTYYIDPKIELT